MRRYLIMVLTFVGGLYFFLEFVLPEETGISDMVAEIGKVTLVIGGFAFLRGVINLLRLHTAKITMRRPGYHNSIALMVALFFMVIVHLWKYYANADDDDSVMRIYNLLWDRIRVPIDSTIFSLLAFYIVSAAYRSFRIKSAEAALMMGTAVIVMLGQIPMGQKVTLWLKGYETSPDWWWLAQVRVDTIREWLMQVMNAAAQRGIILGAAVGALALSMRIWLSLERGSFFDRQ